MPAHKKDVIGNIEALMALRGMVKRDGHINQSDLARASGLDQRSINTILNPDHPGSPTLKTIAKIAKALKVSPWQLLVPNFPFHAVSGPLSRPKISAPGFALLQVYEGANPTVQREIASYAQYVLDRENDPRASQITLPDTSK